MTAATLLKEAGYTVSIYGEAFSCTTSDVAGGQWAPSIVAYDETSAVACHRFFEILKKSFDMHKFRLGSQFGISERTNFCKRRGPSLDKAANAGIIARTRLANLPFKYLNGPGYAYSTLLVEPPIFLEKLRHDLRQNQVPFVQRKFASEADVLTLPEAIIVNCTGLGSKVLFNDLNMKPIKGQLALLKAQPALDYLYSTGRTYVFPRADHVVVGGSQEDNVDDCIPDLTTCRDIIQLAVNAFMGSSMSTIRRKPWMLRNK
ncbi:FAD-dependent oxidoreductase [Mesorhizobium onobrychidis]|uniref:D-amino-acid oxidase n=1 Tax=Mesorhizobium onobrychidis TaxID=2775404 RepID=A0ABY5R8Y6_9HYPH|nr:FAD-dependent oxidoreductase [Mesorhizobium onobrychidis]UVC19447.1 FAD-binding oxidoreductase [Mesorhizobium onobrychidis]